MPTLFKYDHCGAITGDKVYEFIGAYHGDQWRAGPGIAPVTDIFIEIHKQAALNGTIGNNTIDPYRKSLQTHI